MDFRDLCARAAGFKIVIGDGEAGPPLDTVGRWSAAPVVEVVPGEPLLVSLPVARRGGVVRIQVEIGRRIPSAPPPWVTVGELELHLPSGLLRIWGAGTVPDETGTLSVVRAGRYHCTFSARDRDRVTDLDAEWGPDLYRLDLRPMGASGVEPARRPRSDE